MFLGFPFWVNFSVFLGEFLAGVLTFVDSFPVALELLVPSLVDPLLELREDFLLALSSSAVC